jgi:hypothetical protein
MKSYHVLRLENMRAGEDHGQAAASRAREESGRGGAWADGGKIWLGYPRRSTGGDEICRVIGRGEEHGRALFGERSTNEEVLFGVTFIRVCGWVKC